MKMLRYFAFAASLFLAAPTYAQWQTPNHSVPVGRGAGVTGFGSVAPGAAGNVLTSNGPNADPSFQVPGASGAIGTAAGGTGANNSTNNAGDLLVSSGANGSFVHTALNTLCNLAPSACSATLGFTAIAWYGARCDGTTNDTTAIQNAWNAAAALGQNLHLSGAGTSCLISSITQPTPTQRSVGILPPVASMLVGGGPNSVQLVSTVTGAACAITITTPYTNFQPAGEMGGFSLVQVSNVQPSAGGYGICLNAVTKLQIKNVFVRGFVRGIEAFDTINLRISDSTFYYNNWHIHGAVATNTRPNAWLIDNNLIGYAQQYGIYLSHPASVSIVSNTFEANGTDASLSPTTVLCAGQPLDGSVGCVIERNYFEFGQLNEILLQSISGDPISSAHRIVGNVFARSSVTGPFVYIANGASSNMYIVMESNGFLDTVTLTGPYISASAPATANYQVYCVGNTYTNASNMPTKCQAPVANSTWSMDASGIYGGPH